MQERELHFEIVCGSKTFCRSFDFAAVFFYILGDQAPWLLLSPIFLHNFLILRFFNGFSKIGHCIVNEYGGCVP